MINATGAVMGGMRIMTMMIQWVSVIVVAVVAILYVRLSISPVIQIIAIRRSILKLWLWVILGARCGKHVGNVYIRVVDTEGVEIDITDTELIVKAVILLFVTELDEKVFDVIITANSKWCES